MPIKRYSKQRELIRQTVMNTTEHPTAEMVYKSLKPTNPSLSLGTVYRNLNQLVKAESLIRLPFPIERFDGNTAPHAHLLCRCCGRVYDLMSLGYDAALDKRAGRSTGHNIDRHELIFDGTCAQCADMKSQ